MSTSLYSLSLICHFWGCHFIFYVAIQEIIVIAGAYKYVWLCLDMKKGVCDPHIIKHLQEVLRLCCVITDMLHWATLSKSLWNAACRVLSWFWQDFFFFLIAAISLDTNNPGAGNTSILLIIKAKLRRGKG